MNVRTIVFDTVQEETKPSYSLSYYNYTADSGEDYLALTLSLQDYDATWITEADGSQGVWLGIGFDTQSMYTSNVVVCYLGYFGEDLPPTDEVNKLLATDDDSTSTDTQSTQGTQGTQSDAD